MERPTVSPQTLRRLTTYLDYLNTLPADGESTISAATIARHLGLGGVQVRKDLAAVSSGGKPKVGYNHQKLREDLQSFLGCDRTVRAALAGVGNLGRALLAYEELGAWGLQIVAAFDCDPALSGARVHGVRVRSASSMSTICREQDAAIGIITTPAGSAQQACEQMLAGGVRAIWNFAPVNLRVPEGVPVHNENMAASLAILSQQLTESA